ncbi:TPA: plasmid transfer protein, partial [Klebsiella pneumoniae]|nr:plasmid transfer protein [Klebsiella pneumoniae]
MENINNDVPQHQPYRNEKVFNSGKTALELNFSETNGSVNLILAGPLVSKPGSFDWTGQKAFSTKLSDDEVITLCMAFLRLTHEAVLKNKKTKHHNKQVYKNVKVTFDGKSTAMMEGG